MLSLTVMPHFGIGHRACFFCFGETLPRYIRLEIYRTGCMYTAFPLSYVLSIKGFTNKVRAREHRRRTAVELRERRVLLSDDCNTLAYLETQHRYTSLTPHLRAG